VDFSHLRDKGLMNDEGGEDDENCENKENMHPNGYSGGQENDERNRYEIKRYPLNNMHLLKSKSMSEKNLCREKQLAEEDDEGTAARMVRKRKRKSGDQLKILMREFERNQNWSKDTMLDVSKKTGLSEAQVYKWGWDQKRKKYGDDQMNGYIFNNEELDGENGIPS
jgi:hypothetical protein